MSSSMAGNVPPKKNRGRQKVKMEKMEKDSNRQVTFSKRRSGLFKKASELCTLCGAEAAIIVFSPGKKAFSYGHPSVDVILNRFTSSAPPPPCSRQGGGSSSSSRQPPILQTQRDITVQDLNMELTLMNSRLEMEKKRGEELVEVKKSRARENNLWWDVPVEELSLQQVQHFKAQLEELKQHVVQHGNRLVMQASNNQPHPHPHPHPPHPNVVNPHIMGIINPMLGFNPNPNPNPNPTLFANPNLGFGYNHDYNNNYDHN